MFGHKEINKFQVNQSIYQTIVKLSYKLITKNKKISKYLEIKQFISKHMS